MTRRSAARAAAGFTLVEMMLVAAVLSILALAALPTVRYAQLRAKEIELHTALRQMRGAIDEYKRWSDAGLLETELGSDGYPPELEDLTKLHDVVGQVDKQIRFLRRIPVDPMTGKDEWGLRSYQDDPDSTSWGGEDVFDVYSLSTGRGLDGTLYSTW